MSPKKATFKAEPDEALSPLREEDLLAEVARSLIPKSVPITVLREIDRKVIRLHLRVPRETRRYIIGKHGKVISAVRELFSHIGAVEGRQLIVDLAE